MKRKNQTVNQMIKLVKPSDIGPFVINTRIVSAASWFEIIDFIPNDHHSKVFGKYVHFNWKISRKKIRENSNGNYYLIYLICKREDKK